jgi:putative redox protein
MISKIIWKGNLCFEGKSESGHSVTMDSSIKSYGQNEGPSPMEMVTLALGGCTGMDVVSILMKRKVDLKGLEVNINSEQREEYPKVFSRIEIEYLIKGKGIKEEDVVLAINLSRDKYCSVAKILEKTAQINHKWKIINE